MSSLNEEKEDILLKKKENNYGVNPTLFCFCKYKNGIYALREYNLFLKIVMMQIRNKKEAIKEINIIISQNIYKLTKQPNEIFL